MFCKNCGKEIPNDAVVCPACQTATSEAQPVQYAAQQMQRHQVPQCTSCGHIGEMKPGPLLTSKDLLWFFMLLFLCGAGFIFLAYRVITRIDPKKREKVCPHCGSVNMFTYVY